jgi:ABC-type branched-subunit amino acid transport system ATPase component
VSLLEVRNLSGGYSSAPILRDVAIDIGAHEIVGVLGANGAGKPTLLRAISGVLPTCKRSVGDMYLGIT